jgi:hypothetical protein
VRRALDRLVEELDSKRITMRAMLQQLDRNRDRKLNRDEISHGLAEMGVTLTATELDTVMRVFDKDHDGKVEYAEMHAALTTHAAGEPVSIHWSVSQPHEQCSERIRTSARPIAIRFRRGPTRPNSLFVRAWQWLSFNAAERFIWWRDRCDRCSFGRGDLAALLAYRGESRGPRRRASVRVLPAARVPRVLNWTSGNVGGAGLSSQR